MVTNSKNILQQSNLVDVVPTPVVYSWLEVKRVNISVQWQLGDVGPGPGKGRDVASLSTMSRAGHRPELLPSGEKVTRHHLHVEGPVGLVSDHVVVAGPAAVRVGPGQVISAGDGAGRDGVRTAGDHGKRVVMEVIVPD